MTHSAWKCCDCIETANCKCLDENTTIPFFHTRKNSTPLSETANQEDGKEAEQEDERLKWLISQVDIHEPTELKANILTYIAGLVVKKLLKKIKCITCIKSLTSGYICTPNDEHDYHQAPYQRKSHMALTLFLNKGSLHIPSTLVVSIIQYVEYLLSCMRQMRHLTRLTSARSLIPNSSWKC